jgi:hypothetical protein
MSGKLGLKTQIKREQGRLAFWQKLLDALAADDGSAVGIVQGKLAKSQGRLDELVREQSLKAMLPEQPPVAP